MKKVYMDNGSTSFPKAPGVGSAMADFVENLGVNIGRGGYADAYSAAGTVLEVREQLCRLFNFSVPENVVFTSGVTASLNILLKGFLRPGDHVLTSSMEHNAVMRPLRQLEAQGVEVTLIPCHGDGSLCAENIQSLVRPNTRAMVMLHASNVCGTVMPVRQTAQLCRSAGIRFILDCAQTGGLLPIDMEGWGIDALAFTGHKGLLGPQGIGGFLIKKDFAPLLEPLISGGTGSISHLETVPDFMPDRFEAGTQNLPGIFGLHAALDYIERVGTQTLLRLEMERTEALLYGFSRIKGARIIGASRAQERTAAVSVDFPGRDNAEIAYKLERGFGIMTRCGLHCSPSAHKTLGTFPQGTVRFTPGYTTSEEDVEYTLSAVEDLLKA